MQQLKNRFLIVLIAACALCHTACEGDKGETGPLGPQGETGLAGEDGADGHTTSFYFQQGFKGYEGTRDIAIYNSTDVFDDLTPLPTPDGEYLYTFAIENTDNPALTDSATTLIRFEGLAEAIEGQHGESICSGEFFINDATLYLSGVFINQSGDNAYLQLGIYGESSPVFDETSATWEKANDNENWGTPGGSEAWAFNDAFFSSMYGENLGYIHTFNNALSIGPIYHKPFYIPAEAVRQWLCEGNNKGFLFSPLSGESALVIYSSEYSDQSLRPMLYINIEKSDKNTRRKVLSAEEARAIWEQKSYEEKMAPLYQLYPSLRPDAANRGKSVL